MRTWRGLLAGLGAGTSVAAIAYVAVVRPRIRRWGATDEEFGKPLPGDELETPWGHRLISTRAITIDAAPVEVWPWIVQIGHSRAGFYTHEWVERMFGITYADGHSANRIHPEFQDVHVGDRIPFSPLNQCEVIVCDPPRTFIAGEWFVLEPLDNGKRTRVLLRSRGGWLEPVARSLPPPLSLSWPLAALVDRGPGELLHHYMETGMLKGLKLRVEATKAAAQGGPQAA